MKRKFPSAFADFAATITHTSYAEAVSYQGGMRSYEGGRRPVCVQWTSLEKSMAEEMPLGSECKHKFAGIHFRPGMLVVDTVDKN